MNYNEMLKNVKKQLTKENSNNTINNLHILRLSLENIIKNECLKIPDRFSGNKIDKKLRETPFIDILHRGHFYPKIVISEDTVSLTLNTPDKWTETMEEGEVAEYFAFMSMQIKERLPDVKVTKGDISLHDFEFIIQF